jgi:hypothetical protein
MECYINTDVGRNARQLMGSNVNYGDDDDDGTSKLTVSKPREINFCLKIFLFWRISQLLK